MYRSAADLVSRVPQVDPVLQAQYDVTKKIAEERAAAYRKQEEEVKRAADAVQKAKEQGRVKGHARVKAVPTGDSILLSGQPTSPNSLPPEKLLFLSGLEAPKLGRRGGQDEPFAWAAREYLRRLLVGKIVVFAVSYVHQGSDKITGQPVSREYGTILLEDDDVSKLLVANGYARVKVSKNQSDNKAIPQDRQELLDLEQRAKEEKVGIWSEGVADSIKFRTLKSFEKDPKSVFESLKKKPLRGIVEQVRDGSTLRVEVFDPEDESGLTFYSIVVHISGIQCPRVPPPYSVLYEQYLKRKEAGEDVQEPPQERPAAFGPEAKLFTEMRLLNRDVEVQLLSIDKSQNVFGSVLVPQGNIAVSLLKNGLAKFVQWSAQITGEAALLEAAEREAKEKRTNLWRNAQPEVIAANDNRDFTAKVVQILSGDTLIVVDSGNVELKLTLSSIRAPRFGNRRDKPEDFALESKEFLRKKLIGHKVQVIVEYTKTLSEEKEDRVYGAVQFNRQNIAEQLVLNGLALVVSHRMDEQRSAFYDALLAAEEKAKKGKKGMHGANSAPAAKPIVDLSEKVRVPKDADGNEDEDAARRKRDVDVKQKQYLPFLSKQKKSLQGIVEYVFGGNRFKILVPAENIMISFALSGIRCPLLGRSEKEAEPFGLEAARFAKERVLQHDVSIEVESLDKGGNFLGNLLYGRNNLAVDLLQAGLASVYGPSADRSKYKDQLYAAERSAKANKIALWHNYVEKPVEEQPATEEAAAGDEKEDEVAADNSKLSLITVTEIVDPVNFYFQFADNKNLATIEERLAILGAAAGNPCTEPEKGRIYAGLYNDEKWYRCKFERFSEDGGYQVFFVDFGNVDVVPALRFIDRALAEIKPVALSGTLSGLKFARDYYDEAWEAFAACVEAHPVFAEINFVERSSGKHHLTLREAKDSELSINSHLLREGLLRISSRVERRLMHLVKHFKQDETFAKRKHFGIWQYGDVSSDEDEDRPKRA
eukprot:TRINITY_DN2419_c0_g1_i1.p1 TRINITY_DN2419_c0_g1~~TRINITY_DN2419_c0_g1_i1.p1  ORF type:complete len:990 (-),score=358.13 TRINITY_DN2419_c0_g1_i1:152-3121(-)